MLNILLIIGLQLLYVPIYTLCTIFMVRNYTVLAAILGVIETLIYVFGLSLVFDGHRNVVTMVVYSVGFGLGIILGTKLEQKLAIGYINVIINTQEKNNEMIDTLRQKGFGVTMYTGEGRDSDRYSIEVLTKRKREKELIAAVEEFEPDAFIISYEPRKFRGGYLLDRIK